MTTTRRTTVAMTLLLAVTAVVAAVLVIHARGDAAADGASCGPLPAKPGNTVDGVSARLVGLTATIDTRTPVHATMRLVSGEPPATVAFSPGEAADLMLVDGHGNVVGSGNDVHNALGTTPHVVDAEGVEVDVVGRAYRCADLDDPTVSMPSDTTTPLPPGDYRAAGVLSTDDGYLVTDLVPVTVS